MMASFKEFLFISADFMSLFDFFQFMGKFAGEQSSRLFDSSRYFNERPEK